jgi:hypothetical protein
VIQPGDDQVVALATNLNALPLPAVGKYEFVISVDGSPERRLGLRLQPEPGGQLTFRYVLPDVVLVISFLPRGLTAI